MELRPMTAADPTPTPERPEQDEAVRLLRLVRKEQWRYRLGYSYRDNERDPWEDVAAFLDALATPPPVPAAPSDWWDGRFDGVVEDAEGRRFNVALPVTVVEWADADDATSPPVPAAPPGETHAEGRYLCIDYGTPEAAKAAVDEVRVGRFPPLPGAGAVPAAPPLDAIGELTAYLVNEVAEGVYECRVCDADVTTGPHDSDCEVAIVREWLNLPGRARLRPVQEEAPDDHLPG